ncbi:MAG TPA: PQQ-binding-like beta-propeller repeat protein [Candidatus Polarisedimenticolaceae bacterium]|nr:PQQ-binding-like beta-propeller repeat protein [Candidatus Polarisedimenticolaceae bacterium]
MGATLAADAPATMFGNTPARNMVSAETGLPAKWDVKTGLNVKWTAGLGSQSYAGPLVYGGKVFVGTNNERQRNPKLGGDRGVVMVFREADGEFLWQAAHKKLEAGRVNDWPMQGVCSTPAVEGDRVYYVSNRAELVCADTEGFRDGENDGPYTTETDTSNIDEDIVWKLDMIGELDVFPHNLAAGSPLLVGDIVYTVTGNGVDEGHINIPSSEAPSFIAVDKKTGKLLWESNLPGEGILHGSWSNPSYGVVQGVPLVFFPGGNGWLYAFQPKTGELVWKFDLNPKDAVWRLGGRGTRNYVIAMPAFSDGKVYIDVGQDPEHGEGVGHLWAIDASLKGDVTDRAVVWTRGGEEFHRSLSTPVIADGLVYASDLSGFLYCLDAKTGSLYWKYDALAAIWGSPFLADGKVYLGDEDGDIAVLKAGKKLEVIGEYNMGQAVYTTPVAHEGTIFVVGRNSLFALKNGIAAKPAAPPPPPPPPPKQEEGTKKPGA